MPNTMGKSTRTEHTILQAQMVDYGLFSIYTFLKELWIDFTELEYESELIFLSCLLTQFVYV